MSALTFLVFADLHYKKRMYAVTVEHLEKILHRAYAEECDLILHAGDLCNDYAGSPELLKILTDCKLPVFGVYGNHELEGRRNSMSNVTPCLTNRAEEVAWGTEDGRYDETVGYYYYDHADFRLILPDTNYSLMPDGVTYEHNRPASWGCAGENRLGDSLGPCQLAWLERVLWDAADRGLHCVLVSHASFLPWGAWEASPDGAAVRDLYARINRRRPGTVLMSINGHYHTDHVAVEDGVLYFDVNAAINGWWQEEKFDPYAPSKDLAPTFSFVDYDAAGNKIERRQMPLSELRMGAQTLFFEDPLSAVVTVTDDGAIVIRGGKTAWMYGISPQNAPDGVRAEIKDYCKAKTERKYHEAIRDQTRRK